MTNRRGNKSPAVRGGGRGRGRPANVVQGNQLWMMKKMKKTWKMDVTTHKILSLQIAT